MRNYIRKDWKYSKMADLENHKMEKTYNEHITPLDFLIKVGVHVDSSFTEKGEFIRKEEE